MKLRSSGCLCLAARLAFPVLLFAGGCSNEEGTLTVDGSEDVYRAKHSKLIVEGHGDGLAGVRLAGVVVEPGGKPIHGARLRFEPSTLMSDSINQAIDIRSDANGAFEFEAAVGASIAIGGENDGKLLQTSRARLVIEKGGFRAAYLLVDYNMPRLRIVLRPQVGASAPALVTSPPEVSAPRF